MSNNCEVTRSIRRRKPTGVFVAGHLPSTDEGSWPVSFLQFFFSFSFFFCFFLFPPVYQPTLTRICTRKDGENLEDSLFFPTEKTTT